MIFHRIRKFFLPHPENGHVPHIFRYEVSAFLILSVLLLEGFLLLPADRIVTLRNYAATIMGPVLVDYANDTRTDLALAPLRQNKLLEQAAQLKALDMARKGYFAHTSPDGITPWYWFDSVGYKYIHAGENLAVNFIDSSDVHNAWMNSPTHRANIVSDKYAEIGIATAKGMFQGREAVFVVELFGTSAKTIVVVPTLPEPSTPTIASPAPIQTVRPTVTTVPTETTVVLAETTSTDKITNIDVVSVTNIGERMIAQPKTMASSVLSVLLAVVGFALLGMVFIRGETKRHPYVMNGMLLILVLSVALYANEKVLALAGMIL